MKTIAKIASAIALTIAAGSALADNTVAAISGTNQNQLGGFGNSQTMDLSVVTTSPFGAYRSTWLVGGQYNQTQAGSANVQRMEVSVIKGTANPFFSHGSSVSVGGTVSQYQAGFGNFQRTSIGVVQ